MSGGYRQNGFTLLEMVAALAGVAVVLSGASALFFQETSGTATAKNAVAASLDMEAAVSRMRKDGAMAYSSDLVDGAAPVSQLTLRWTEWYELSGTLYESTYWVSGTDLKRDYDGTVTTVAQNISSVAFSMNGDVVTVTMSYAPRWTPSRAVVRTFQFLVRP